MSLVSIILGCLALVSFLVGLFLTVRSNWPRQLFKLIFSSFSSILFILVGMICASLAWELGGFSEYDFEGPIAEVETRQLDGQEFEVSIRYPNQIENEQAEKVFVISGDQWRIDARFIAWEEGFLAMVFVPMYQLERIEGRYQDIQDQKEKPVSVFALKQEELAFDIWQLGQQGFIPGMRSQQGTGVYVPSGNGAVYRLFLEPSGLRVEPYNDVAREVLLEWK